MSALGQNQTCAVQLGMCAKGQLRTFCPQNSRKVHCLFGLLAYANGRDICVGE
jgi:hypothetical protein